MIPTAIGAYRKMRNGTFDPKRFAVDQAMGMLKGALIIVSCISIPLIVLLGVLGYSNWLVHANSVARFFFWFFLVIYSIWYYIAQTVFKRIKRGAEYAANKILPD